MIYQVDDDQQGIDGQVGCEVDQEPTVVEQSICGAFEGVLHASYRLRLVHERSAKKLREDLAPGFVANCTTWKDMPHRDLGRSLGALDTLIEMLQVQILFSFT
jgi:hypothetical protein